MKTAVVILLVFLASCAKVDVVPIGNIAPDELTIISGSTEQSATKSAGQTLIPNAGGTGTTDWIGRGCADGWSYDYPGMEKRSLVSIKSGQCPMIGMTQTITNTFQFALYSPIVNLPQARYTLSFFYMTDTPVWIIVRVTKGCGWYAGHLKPTNGVQFFTCTFYSNVVQVMFYNSPVGGTFQVDQINLTR